MGARQAVVPTPACHAIEVKSVSGSIRDPQLIPDRRRELTVNTVNNLAGEKRGEPVITAQWSGRFYHGAGESTATSSTDALWQLTAVLCTTSLADRLSCRCVHLSPDRSHA